MNNALVATRPVFIRFSVGLITARPKINAEIQLRSPCGAGIGQLLYNYDGKVYTCDEGRTWIKRSTR